MKKLFEARKNLELKKNSLESTLQDNLMRRQDELKSNWQESSTEDQSHKLLSLRRETEVVEQATAKLQQQKVKYSSFKIPTMSC